MKRKNKILSILLHVFLWIIVFLWPLSYIITQDEISTIQIWWNISVFSILICIFYFNYSLLIPKLVFKGKKYFLYALIIVSVIAILFVGNNYAHKKMRMMQNDQQEFIDNRMPPPNANPEFRQGPPPGQNPIDNLGPGPNSQLKSNAPPFINTPMFLPIASIIILILGFAARISISWSEKDKQNRQIAEEQISTELSFLKNQVSPHFFFNTLNNIYSLIETDAEKAKDVTYKLSKLMRYLLYESEKKRNVNLSMEIDFAINYIELMKVRLGENTIINTDFYSTKDQTKVPPLLFNAFLENVFKHGVSTQEDNSIHISIQKIDKAVRFSIINTIPKHKKDVEAGGLGIANTKRRLDIIYGEGNYSLEIKQTDLVYDVELIIPVE